MLKVGLDLRPTEEGFKAHFGRGTGRYTNEVLSRLVQLGKETEDWCSIHPVGVETLGGSSFERNLIGKLPYGRHTVEQQLLLPKRIDRLGLDLFHYFAHVDAPLFTKTPAILTVLDLIPMKFAELYKADKPNWRFHFARYLEIQAIRRARGIIAISEATKKDVIEILGVPEDQIVVTPLAASEDFSARDLEDQAQRSVVEHNRQKLGLPTSRPILLYVGGIDARKNVPFLLNLLKELVNSSSGPESPLLLLVGRYEKDDRYPALLRQIKELQLEDSVLLTGFVPDGQLLSYYHAADVFVFPSLYEGFGLPVLEAMASGVPVVAANNSSIPEVAGQAAELVADNDKAAWLTALRGVLGNRDRQLSLAEAGVKRAALFSWERTAIETLRAYMYFQSEEATQSFERWQHERQPDSVEGTSAGLA
jgi:glycosyltransferase involved in cell wall biosynthesis